MDNDKPNRPAATRHEHISTIPHKGLGVSGTVSSTSLENGTLYSCYIDDFVASPDNYAELIHILYNAEEGDEIEILINSYGGWVETGIAILTALKYTNAKVTSVAYGICASIAAIIWAACPNRLISKNATIMFHMPSGMFGGKARDTEEETHNMQAYFTEVLKKINKDGLLSEEEITEIVENRRDFYLPGDRIKNAKTL